MLSSTSRRKLFALISWLSFGCTAPSWSGESIVFRRHDINRESTYCACAAFDVDHDGRMDIVSGGWWYRAPNWERRFLREVENIRGRFDDYSNLPLDVNGDGWMDMISANYRSQSLYWVEHPGEGLGEWAKHVIDTPGPMETGRLADVNGDGRLDVLPNGTKFAAWWELQPSGEGKGEVTWVRHDLPEPMAGHGIGCGDINGDGRPDLVGPRGWLEGDPNRPGEAWKFHQEFSLVGGASIPVLVYDVDRDGDSDLVWGQGHRIGLYWMEQRRGDAERGPWVQHAIDTSWSQAHSLLLGDVDGDGHDDLIAGKRYMGHDGKDPGEYDPLVAYWYTFDAARRVWHRHWICGPSPVGFGLDPKAVDLDADGDLDIVAAGRSGLYWLENLRLGGTQRESVRTSPPQPPEYTDHRRLMEYIDERGERHDVRSPAELAIRRWHILAGMETAMGPMPDPSRRAPLDVTVEEEVQTEKFIRRRIRYTAEPGDRVPAYLLIPRDGRGKHPAVVCLHPTNRLGKDEVAGVAGRPSRQYGRELAERGFVCLVPDYPSFGEYNYDFQEPPGPYISGTMKGIWNHIRGIDVLESCPEVDSTRIGCIGHSLGGHNALFLAAFDQRIRAVVTSCGFTALHNYYGGNLKGWTSDRYMPLIASRYDCDPDRVPFDFHEVLGAICPRSIFVSAPLEDSNFDVQGVRDVIAEVQKAYAFYDSPSRLKVVYPEGGHDFPEPVREEAYRWLADQLKK